MRVEQSRYSQCKLFRAGAPNPIVSGVQSHQHLTQPVVRFTSQDTVKLSCLGGCDLLQVVSGSAVNLSGVGVDSYQPSNIQGTVNLLVWEGTASLSVSGDSS